MKSYEFQNPAWYFGRSSVNSVMHLIDNAVYGFKELAGCKIFLKPYQLKTVMRCLAEKNCRYMIADEVGLGKTIEASAVLKVFLAEKKNKNVLIIVPEALTEQWKTELAFKFRLFEGKNTNDNYIFVKPFGSIMSVCGNYDFIIVDEVHRLLNDPLKYNKVLKISKSAENVLMLSATPVQSRNEEYHRLLSLIQPDKYFSMTEGEFKHLLDLQTSVIRKVHSVTECFIDYKETIKDSEYEHVDDTEEIYEELIEVLEDIACTTNDVVIKKDIEKLNYEDEDFCVGKLEKMIAYICEAYQLEKCVIRNRRKNDENSNKRELKEVSYEMDSDFNNTEFRIYSLLSELIESQYVRDEDFDRKYMPLILSFFSSSEAFGSFIMNDKNISDEIRELTQSWINEDMASVKNIREFLNQPNDSMSRILTVCDYIEQEAYDKKVLVFTHFIETFDLYRKAFVNLFGEECCAFFCKGMASDELELNTYCFQTKNNCRIMLSDETGGEGRNFQSADLLINIDIPWSANTLEQRIGRLDRIGRDINKPVLSVVVYAYDSIEKDLVDIWNKGLNIFNKSQSGLEIIMDDIDNKIKAAAAKDFKYGLSSIVNDMVYEIRELEKRVKEERHYDINAYQYQTINKQIEKSVEGYVKNETEYFGRSMMAWASLAGFRADKVFGNIIKFTDESFSLRSAYNTMLVPPDMKAVTEDKLNKMQNHIRILNGDREIKNNPHVIQGTFDRSLALANDYLHFFAPGDEIFDCIIDNALSAYKGKCSAIALRAEFDWEGIVFNWYMQPNNLYILKNNVPVRALNFYKGFMSSDIISIPISANEEFEANTECAANLFRKLPKLSRVQIKKYISNFGQRSQKSDFPGIKDKNDLSNLQWFKENHPETEWIDTVSKSYKESQKKLNEEFRKKNRQFALLQEAVIRSQSSAQASADYFGSKADMNEIKRVNSIIIEAFKKPKTILDSVCYVRMIKNG